MPEGHVRQTEDFQPGALEALPGAACGECRLDTLSGVDFRRDLEGLGTRCLPTYDKLRRKEQGFILRDAANLHSTELC